jgi:hypothetical protein
VIKNGEAVRRLEIEFLWKEKADLLKNIRLVEALYKEAVVLGVFPFKHSLSDLDTVIKIARVVNSVSKSP